MKRWLEKIVEFIRGTSDEHMSAFAGQTAFFIFLSIFPIANILLSLTKVLPYTEAQLIDIIKRVIPYDFEVYMIDIIDDIYSNNSNSLTVISIILGFWSGAKGIMAIRNGLNEAYRSREQRNYFISRGISTLYTIIFVIFLVILMVFNLFGTQISEYVIRFFPEFINVTGLIYGVRYTGSFIILLILMWLMYWFIPNRKLKFRNQFWGAMFASLSWVAVSKLFAIYIDYIVSKSYMYGSLTTVIMILLWLYSISNIIFMGAQINEFLYQHIFKAKEEIKKEKKKEKKRKKMERLIEKRKEIQRRESPSDND